MAPSQAMVRVQGRTPSLRSAPSPAPGAPPGPGHWAEDLVSGATASFCSKLLLQPFDTTKTVLQGPSQVRGGYTNLVECMVGLARSRGAGSLYRGLLASVAVSAPSSALFFAAYERIKGAAERAGRDPALPLGFLVPLAPALASALGNCVSSVVRVPPEVIKQRVQAGQFGNVLEALHGIWRAQGLQGFYTGYAAMVARDIPYAAAQFTVFEALKRRRERALRRKRAAAATTNTATSGTTTITTSSSSSCGSDNSSRSKGSLTKGEVVLSNLWMGAASGALASILTAPIDVVKTRVMTQQAAHAGAYLGMRATFFRILAEEGVQAFGRGLVPRVMYKVPASALFLVCYEGMRMLLQSTRSTSSPFFRGVPLPSGIPVANGLPSLVVGRQVAQGARGKASTATESEGDSEAAEAVQSTTGEGAARQGPLTVARGQSTVTQIQRERGRGQGERMGGGQSHSASAQSKEGAFSGAVDSRQLLCLASLAGTITFHS